MNGEKVARQVGKIAATASTIAGAINVIRDDEHGEIESVTAGPVAVFWRDAKGNPRVLGIPFGRWFRGPRK